MKKMNWDDLRIVLAICREGSLSGAARALASSHSTVFRQINTIEERFETRFFDRLPHGYEMTEAGETVMRAASNIEEDILDLTRELQGKDLRLKGSIRLTAPEGVAHYLLAPYLASFLRKNPDIHIELIASSENLVLSRREADIALRVTSNPPLESIGKKVCDFRLAVYATKAFIDASNDQELTEYDYVITNDGLHVPPASIWKKKEKPKIVFQSHTILAVVNAAKEGMGATIIPCFIGNREKELLQLTPPLTDLRSELWILTHADLRQTARVRALMTHLYECFTVEKRLFEEGE